MVTTRLNAWANIKPWLIGVLLSTAGMFLGYDLGSAMARLSRASSFCTGA